MIEVYQGEADGYDLTGCYYEWNYMLLELLYHAVYEDLADEG